MSTLTAETTADLEQVPPRRRRRHGRIYRLVAALVVAFGLAFGGMSAFTPEAQASATFGNVFVVATVSYDCGSHQILVTPMSNEQLNGQFSVYSQAQVHDRISGKWITSTWIRDDGITSHVLYNFRSFDPYAYVTYARVMNGRWVYQSEWVQIVPTLDSMGPFCNP